MAQPQRQEFQPVDLSVGEILRRTRVHYGQSCKDIEAVLRIRADQIEAIEQGDFEKLPARVYAIGFVRSYAEFLGLDGDKIVDLFKAESANRSSDPVLNFPVAASDSKAPPLWLALACLVLLLMIASMWWGAQDESRASVENVPEVPATLKSETLQEQQEQVLEAPEEVSLNTTEQQEQIEESAAVPQEPKQKGIILNLKTNSWVEIRDKARKVILSRVLKAGEQYFVPDHAALTMSLGNAGGVEIQVNGDTLKPVGAQAQVVRDIPLNAEMLKKRFGLLTSQSQTPTVSQNVIDNSAR